MSIVNSEENFSKDQVDDPRWELSSESESRELVEEDLSDSEILERTKALRLDA